MCGFFFLRTYIQDFYRGHKFERTTRHPRRKVKLARSLELRDSGWATDINLAFISI